MHVPTALALQAASVPGRSGRGEPGTPGQPRASGPAVTDAEEAFGRVTRLAVRLLEAPAAWLALPCGADEVLVATVGLLPSAIPGAHGIVARIPSDTGFLGVSDLAACESLADLPLASGALGLRFLAAVSVLGPDGAPLGALCVGGPVPRTLGPEGIAELRDLAALASAEAARLGPDALLPCAPLDAPSSLPGRAGLARDLAALPIDRAEDRAGDQAGDQGRAGRLAVLVDLDRAAQAADFMAVPGCSGEELMGRIAGVIAAVLPPGVTLYRLEGARFAMLLPEHGHRAVLNRLVGALRVPVACGTVPVLLAPRIGAAPFAPGRHSVDTLLRAAAAAAHGAPGTGGHEGWSLYDAEADRAQARALRLLSDLHPALGARDPGRAGRIALHYQPRIDLRTGRCDAAEALLRWEHPALGGVPPGELMPLVERTALPRALTNWVLEQALADVARWRADGLPMRVSVNVSAPNLAEPDLPRRIGQLLDRCRLPPEALELELTEDALLHGAHLRRTLQEVARLGVALAIDDFGTGYSNLAYLRTLPAQVLKLDRSFVQRLPHSARDRTIVQALVAMSHDLGLRVVAEGVEDEATLGLLRGWSCDEAQGFLFARAMPADAMPGWLSSHHRGARSAPGQVEPAPA